MKRQTGFYLMKRLIRELKPLLPIILVTIILGVLGFLVAIGIAVFAVLAWGALIDESLVLSFNWAIVLMIVCAVSRGFLRYGEQLSGHYIAFKILAVLRDKVFAKLRTLAPAKLQGKDKGDLISLITSDIERLEVFYAHTIAPIMIAILTNGIMTVILGWIHPVYGWLGAGYFLLVGFIIPYFSSAAVSKIAVNYRQALASSNQYVLDSLRGLKEILLFNQGQEQLEKLKQKSGNLNQNVEKMKVHEGIVSGVTSLVITSAMLMFLGIGYYFYVTQTLNLTFILLAVVMIASSFGPVTALSNLSNTLSHTFASAQRLFDLFDEAPQVAEIMGDEPVSMKRLDFETVTFRYPNCEAYVFKEASVHIKKGDKVALIGKSGAGKSTFIKLLMRYFDASQGQVLIDDVAIQEIPTASLREKQTLVEQETHLFNDTLFNNIRIGKQDANMEQVIQATKKAAIHEFIETLPQGYETKVGELGERLSSGERQRLGLARAFLHEGEVLILDEPTSHLDALNEGIILKSIADNSQDQTIILISHRQSSTSICDHIYRVKQLRLEEAYDVSD